MDSNKIVIDSFKLVVKEKEKFIHYFYDHLFELAPETKHLFSNVSKVQQGEKLYKSLVILVENISTPENLVQILKPLGDRHVEYGSQIRHYPVVGQCLIDSIKYCLGSENWSNEIEEAWTETYQKVVMLMVN